MDGSMPSTSALEENDVCKLCQQDQVHTAESTIAIGGCGHRACRRCMKSYIEMELELQRLPLLCPICVADPEYEPEVIDRSITNLLGISEETLGKWGTHSTSLIAENEGFLAPDSMHIDNSSADSYRLQREESEKRALEESRKVMDTSSTRSSSVDLPEERGKGRVSTDESPVSAPPQSDSFRVLDNKDGSALLNGHIIDVHQLCLLANKRGPKACRDPYIFRQIGIELGLPFKGNPPLVSVDAGNALLELFKKYKGKSFAPSRQVLQAIMERKLRELSDHY